MKIKVYQEPGSFAKIDQLPMTRDWMDLTFDRHAYQCFPVSMANRAGIGISFTKDVSFIWDGVNTSSDHHIKITNGVEFADSRRGNRTVSFDTGIYFSPEENLSLMTMPPPNVFLDGIQCISTIISTSALIGTLPIAVMVTKANEEVVIPAGTIIASLLPVSLSELNNTEVSIISGRPEFMSSQEWNIRVRERGDESQRLNSKGEWTHFYRNAVDHNGLPYGMHEAKKITIKVSNED